MKKKLPILRILFVFNIFLTLIIALPNFFEWRSPVYNFFYSTKELSQLNLAGYISSLVFLFLLLQAAAFILIVFIGIFKWIKFRGDVERKELAKKQVVRGMVGFVLVFLFWMLINFIEIFFITPYPTGLEIPSVNP